MGLLRAWPAELFHTRAWTAHAAEVHAQLARLGLAQDAKRASEARAAAEEERLAAGHAAALQARDGLAHEAARLAPLLGQMQAHASGSLPGPGFWSQPDDALQRAAPWNGGAFRAALDEVFVAAVCLHRAFIMAPPRTLKGPLNAVAPARRHLADRPHPGIVPRPAGQAGREGWPAQRRAATDGVDHPRALG